MPNELKLMFAEELGIYDIKALATTCREMNKLLTPFMYRRAKDSKTKDGRPYFLLAVDHGNLAEVKRFVEVGASVNMTDTVTQSPVTAIHSCATFGHVEIAKFLIEMGSTVSAVDSLGGGPLLDVVTGINPKEEMVKLLVEAGADMKASWAPGRTVLHDAVLTGNVGMVQCLLDLGADPNAASRAGTRPMDLASPDSNGQTIRRLLEAKQNEIRDHAHGRLHGLRSGNTSSTGS